MPAFGRRRLLLAGLGVLGGASLDRLAFQDESQARVESRRRSRALGSEIELTVLHESAEAGERAIDAALAAIDEVEQVMSLYRSSSQLCELNRTGGLDQPHADLVKVLNLAQQLSADTAGAFDVSMQPLWLCWSQAKRELRLPYPAEIAAARQLVDWQAIAVSPQRISLQQPGMQLTLNGVAQGFAADRAVESLRSSGVAHALINTGEIHSLGRKAAGEPWSVGIQHPHHDDAYVALTRLQGRALSTSGDYATSFTPDRRHHHIVDPRVGLSPTELSSVSIVAPTAVEADALSTAVLVLGREAGLRLIATRSNVDALLVDKRGRVTKTPGFPEEVVS